LTDSKAIGPLQKKKGQLWTGGTERSVPLPEGREETGYGPRTKKGDGDGVLERKTARRRAFQEKTRVQ